MHSSKRRKCKPDPVDFIGKRKERVIDEQASSRHWVLETNEVSVAKCREDEEENLTRKISVDEKILDSGFWILQEILHFQSVVRQIVSKDGVRWLKKRLQGRSNMLESYI